MLGPRNSAHIYMRIGKAPAGQRCAFSCAPRDQMSNLNGTYIRSRLPTHRLSVWRWRIGGNAFALQCKSRIIHCSCVETTIVSYQGTFCNPQTLRAKVRQVNSGCGMQAMNEKAVTGMSVTRIHFAAGKPSEPKSIKLTQDAVWRR